MMEVVAVKKLAAVTVVALMAAAPLWCCCFQGTASAGAAATVFQSQGRPAHCASRAGETPAGHHAQAKDCDCPQILADISPFGVKGTDQAGGSPREILDGLPDFTGSYPAALVASLAAGPDFFRDLARRVTPLFILQHALRI